MKKKFLTAPLERQSASSGSGAFKKDARLSTGKETSFLPSLRAPQDRPAGDPAPAGVAGAGAKLGEFGVRQHQPVEAVLVRGWKQRGGGRVQEVGSGGGASNGRGAHLLQDQIRGTALGGRRSRIQYAEVAVQRDFISEVVHEGAVRLQRPERFSYLARGANVHRAAPRCFNKLSKYE